MKLRTALLGLGGIAAFSGAIYCWSKGGFIYTLALLLAAIVLLILALLLSVMPITAELEIISCTPIPPTRWQKFCRRFRPEAVEFFQTLAFIFTIAGGYMIWSAIMSEGFSLQDRLIAIGIGFVTMLGVSWIPYKIAERLRK